MSLSDRLLAPWRAAAVTDRIAHTLNRLERLMADTSALLNNVAAGITALGQPVADLIAENTRLAARNAELEGEDAAESSAADAVKVAFDGLASKFDSPDVPDVAPLPLPAPEPVDDTA